MKAKILIILIVSGIIASFGASSFSKESKSSLQSEEQSTKASAAEPVGGFVSEDH